MGRSCSVAGGRGLGEGSGAVARVVATRKDGLAWERALETFGEADLDLIQSQSQIEGTIELQD